MSDRPLAVGLLAPCYWPEVRRGGERLVNQLARGLVNRHHEPTLITSHAGRPSRAIDDGVTVIRNWRPPDRRLQSRLFEDHLTHVPFSYLSLRRIGPDVAHAFHGPDGVAAARWSRRTGRPAVLSFLGIPHRVGLTQRRGRVELLLHAIDGCAAVTVLSEAAAHGFRRWLGVESTVVYPGVDLDAFAVGSERTDDPTVFCPADPAIDNKRVGLLVTAFTILKRHKPNARLVLQRPGDPVLAERLERVAPGIDLVDPGPWELAQIYGHSWVCAVPSWGEAFGLVLLESLACGTPVVGAASGGTPELVDRPAVGRLLESEDAEDLARLLLEAMDLASDPATRRACRERAEDFSAERSVTAYERLYARVVG